MRLDVGLGRRRQDLGKDFWVKIRLWRPLPRGHSGGCALRRQGLGRRVATAVPGLPTPRGWRPAGRTGPSPGAGGVGEGSSARTVQAPLPAGRRAPGPAGSHLSGPRGAPGCGPRHRLAPLSWLPRGQGGSQHGGAADMYGPPEEGPRPGCAGAAACSRVAKPPRRGHGLRSKHGLREAPQGERPRAGPPRTWGPKPRLASPGVERPPVGGPSARPTQPLTLLPPPPWCHSLAGRPPCSPAVLAVDLPAKPLGKGLSGRGCSRQGWARQTSRASVTELVGMGPWAWV